MSLETGSDVLVSWPRPQAQLMLHERLQTERLRALIMTGLIGTGLMAYLGTGLMPGEAGQRLRGGFDTLMPGVVVLSVAAALGELGAALLIGRWLRQDALAAARSYFPSLMYLWSSIEVTFPTLAVLTWVHEGGHPVAVIASPVCLFYVLFILFSILRLDFWLCTYTGFMAGAQYLAAAMLVLQRVTPAERGILPGISVAPARYVIMAALYAMAGLVAGFVAVRLRGQFDRMIRSMQERSRVASIFGQHVSPAVMDKLLNQPVELQGEIRHVCVMFLDLRNFSVFAESHAPGEVVRYLNMLFQSMIDAVNRHRGVVNKFLGDGFLAVFGAPVDDRQECRHALEAAREILSELDLINSAGAIAPTRVGIGLHAGQVITGNVGSEVRKEYTIIGSVVNIASRLEQLNKQFGSRLLVSETVWKACGGDGADGIDLGVVPIKGQSEPVRVYQLA